MERQNTEDIIKFLKDNIEPMEDNSYGQGYRAAAYLTDGTFLPCVIFRNPSTVVNLAIKRFKDEQSGNSIFAKSSGIGYNDIVKTFVTRGNCVNEYDISKVELSKHSFPLQTIKLIRGETKMGWTGFVAKMKDGKQFAFGTDFYFSFFEMPTNYHPNDIVEIINHTYIGKDNELKSYHASDVYDVFTHDMVFRSKPFFDCFMDNL
jgi:hypothetical protein